MMFISGTEPDAVLESGNVFIEKTGGDNTASLRIYCVSVQHLRGSYDGMNGISIRSDKRHIHFGYELKKLKSKVLMCGNSP